MPILERRLVTRSQGTEMSQNISNKQKPEPLLCPRTHSAAFLGVTVATIRRWEKLGLLVGNPSGKPNCRALNIIAQARTRGRKDRVPSLHVSTGGTGIVVGALAGGAAHD
jgi:hypothetical protein